MILSPSGFRPLIRGFFFYLPRVLRNDHRPMRVSVPSFGDSFFIDFGYWRKALSRIQFPSPHSGILFLFGGYDQPQLDFEDSFRPLIRGFFFYPYQGGTKVVTLEKGFPSPHSGILFLSGPTASTA